MKVLIIEDELTLAKALMNDIRRVRPAADIIACTTNIKESVSTIQDNPDIDIIFSDIKIDDGVSFSIFENVDTSAMIVFTTAYNEYALKAFDFNCIDYLLKPITEASLNKAFNKCENNFDRLAAREVKDIIADIPNITTYRKRLFLERGQDTIIVKTEDICYIYTERGYTKIYTADGRWGTTGVSLIELSSSLNPSIFCRISRQCIVNIEYVASISAGTGRDYNITMRTPYTDTSFMITPDRKKELMHLLDK